MQIKDQGFTLIEMLVVIALSSVLLLGSMRIFSVLQRDVLREYQSGSARESVWQLAYRIGKHCQRAGYCRGSCKIPALRTEQEEHKVLLYWEDPHSENRRDEQYLCVGYRLHQGEMQILKTTKLAKGERWEKISDPDLVTFTHFSVTRLLRRAGPPLLVIELVARQKQVPSLIRMRHIVRGENL